LIQDPMAIFSICAAVCAVVFWSAAQPWSARVYRIVPSVVLVYYIPSLLAAAGVLPHQSPVYDWMRDYLLPFSLFVLLFTMDVPTILKIGPKAIAVMLLGTAGVIVGAPIAYLIFQPWLPPETWKALAALSGSWIGGGGNFAAIKESVGASDLLVGPIIVVDTAVGYTWTGVLLFLAAYQHKFDRWNRADSGLIVELDRRLSAIRAETARTLNMLDVTGTVALGFLGAVVCGWAGNYLDATIDPVLRAFSPALGSIFSSFTWLVILITFGGTILSFTPVRRMERGGASKIGYGALYLFLTSLGAKASLAGILETPILLLVGVTWILFHIVILFVGARLLRAPLFLVAMGSQANIGGAATAPIVAAAYYEALAPVGVLMGLLGYLVGTYGGLLCAFLLRLAA
jgi:uncharacterized membrane protein